MKEFRFICITLVILTTSHITKASKESPKCKLDRVHKLLAFNCAKTELVAIPKNLKSSIEILDASGNRIRKLTRDSFSNYQKLRFLYLSENFIGKILPGTFSSLKALETLDLSKNGIRVVPPEIFNLPSLKKLYLADIDLGNEGFAGIKKPVAAPLAYLNIASTEIDRIPDFGALPDLQVLILSGNELTNIVPEQFAPFCELTFVDLNQTNIEPCQCHRINLFMSEEMKKVPMLNCGAVPAKCNLSFNASFDGPRNYAACVTLKTELLEARSFDVEISSLPALFVVGILVFFVLIIFASCRGAPKRHVPPQSRDEVDGNHNLSMMSVNPNSRNTLIM